MALLNRNLNLANFDRQRHPIGRPRLQTTRNCLANILQSFSFRRPLGYTPRNCWTLGDNHAGLIRLQRNKELHT